MSGRQEHDSTQFDPIEGALEELCAAERAGVFARTCVDTSTLVSAPVRLAGRRLALRLVPLAAAVVLAVGAGSWMFMAELGTVRHRVDMASTPANTPQDSRTATLAECLAGPRELMATGCGRLDYDSDGDVDLADVSAYQLAYAGPARSH